MSQSSLLPGLMLSAPQLCYGSSYTASNQKCTIQLFKNTLTLTFYWKLGSLWKVFLISKGWGHCVISDPDLWCLELCYLKISMQLHQEWGRDKIVWSHSLFQIIIMVILIVWLYNCIQAKSNKILSLIQVPENKQLSLTITAVNCISSLFMYSLI